MSDAGRMCDELRLMARLVREYDYEEISRMLREAADTILVMDERLREADRHHRIDMEVIGLMYHPEIVERLEAENATLRTQLADVTKSMRRVEERCIEERCARLRECFPAEIGKNRGRICPTCGCIVFDDEECCPDCNAEVDG